MGSPGDVVTKTRSRIKKICICGTSWLLVGISCALIGILLLAYYAKYWNDDAHWQRGLAYAGIAFLLTGLILFGIGITFCIALYVVWKRLDTAGDFASNQFKPPTYAPGSAPYPQQATTSPVYTQVSAAEPSAPTMEPPKTTDDQDIRVEIEEHHKF